MKIKEKLHHKKFWIGVATMMFLFPIGTMCILLWWEYGFDFSAYRTDQPFSNSMPLFALFQIVKGFIFGFFVMLFSFQAKGKPVPNRWPKP